MKTSALFFAVSIATALAAGSANASCYKKAANATAVSEKDAKWYVMETIVQQVDWGIWPAYVANGSTPGYKVSNKMFKCKASGSLVSCYGQATLCETKK